MTRWRLPKTLWICPDGKSAGLLVAVRQVSREELKDLGSDHDDEELLGLWRADQATIYVLRTLRARQKNSVFWHEVQHCLVDSLGRD